MLKFYKDISLSIDLVNKLGDKPSRVTDLAESLDTTHYNLQRLVRKLSNAGVVKSVRGKGGGISKIEGDVSLRVLFAAFYSDPLNEIKNSDKPSDKLNYLYLHFLDALSVYKKDFPEVENITEESPILEDTDLTEEREELLLDFVDTSSWGDGW